MANKITSLAAAMTLLFHIGIPGAGPLIRDINHNLYENNHQGNTTWCQSSADRSQATEISGGWQADRLLALWRRKFRAA